MPLDDVLMDMRKALADWPTWLKAAASAGLVAFLIVCSRGCRRSQLKLPADQKEPLNTERDATSPTPTISTSPTQCGAPPTSTDDEAANGSVSPSLDVHITIDSGTWPDNSFAETPLTTPAQTSLPPAPPPTPLIPNSCSAADVATVHAVTQAFRKVDTTWSLKETNDESPDPLKTDVITRSMGPSLNAVDTDITDVFASKPAPKSAPVLTPINASEDSPKQPAMLSTSSTAESVNPDALFDVVESQNFNDIVEDVRRRLQEKYEPETLEIFPCSSKRIAIVCTSAKFEGMPKADRRDEVTQFLASDLGSGRLTGLNCILKTPHEKHVSEKKLEG